MSTHSTVHSSFKNCFTSQFDLFIFFSLTFHFSGKLTPGFTVEVVTEPYVLKGKLEGHIYFKPETYRMWAIEPETEVTVSLFPENKIDRPHEITFPVSKEDIIMRRKLIVLSHIGFPNLANTTEAYILVIGVQKIQLRLKTWRLGKFLKNWHCRWRWNIFTLKRNFCECVTSCPGFPISQPPPPPFNRMRVRWKKSQSTCSKKLRIDGNSPRKINFPYMLGFGLW